MANSKHQHDACQRDLVVVDGPLCSFSTRDQLSDELFPALAVGRRNEDIAGLSDDAVYDHGGVGVMNANIKSKSDKHGVNDARAESGQHHRTQHRQHTTHKRRALVTQRRQESVPRDEERGEQVSEAGNGNLLLNLIRSSCPAATAELPTANIT